jgi:hypothetical protein
MATSPPNMTFRRYLIGSRLVAWNSLLLRLDDIQLSSGPDEYQWNLHANDTFLVDSHYKAILQSDIPVNNNKKIWKMKIPLKPKKLDGIFVAGLFSPKIVLLNETGMEVLSVFSVIKTKLLNTYSSSTASLDLYGHSSK